MLGPYPLNPARIEGGVEAVVVRVAEGLSHLRDVELHLVTCQRAVERAYTRQEGRVSLHYLPRSSMGHITFHLRDRRRMVRLLHRISPDVVHGQGTGMYAGAALDSGYPAVIGIHGIMFRESALVGTPWRRFQRSMASAYEKQCLKRARDIIPCSPYAVQELSQWIKGTVHHIDNPADNRFFALEDEAEAGRVLLPARIMPRKNVLWLVQAWAEVVKSFPGARLRVAGEVHSHPGYVERVRRFVEEHDLQENVDLLGSLDQQQLLEEYARCSLVVLPSVQETSPVVVVEALAAGRPVVATRVCGLPFLVSDGDTGFLVELDDTESMTRALIKLLADDGLRQRMGRRAREDAEGRFKIDVVARQTYEVYRQVIEKAGL